ncbi:hybrid sensor histidine kinase/response regulator [Frateuria hangzhouensis]|uniref:hybrid sensor histidine kinase/response regulator n=1 Tax=Frateuria hangzhouensis TaxID=2995589 RepID=UPI002260FEC0|nr:PAS domain S-box protein [Frateuria sp. STR12]MCX7513633.1 PAS domain S-box protein [Frateuria sp. STR12]
MAVALREQRSVRGEEAVAERPDGSRITFVPYPTPLFDRQGTLVGAINTLVDVTDRKQGEQAMRDLNEALEEHVRERTQQAQDAFLRLHRSERSLALLVDSVVDYAIYMLDLDGHVISWNAGAERIKGYRAGEITGRSFGCFYTHEDRRAGMPHRALQRARQDGRYAAEGWRVRKDGSRFWASVIIDPVYDAGELVGYAKVTRDVTEKRKTERALTESERRARGVIDTALDAFAQLDDKGTILEWNPCAESMYGWRRDDVLGRELATLIFAPPEQLLFRQCLPDRLSLPPGGKQPRQIKSRRRDGTELIVEVTSSVLRLDQGRLFNVFLRDLTEKIQIESQLRQAQKMEAVGKLTGGIAHDFNNLLQGIIGSLELVHLRVQSGRNDQVEKLLEGAGESASRAAALTHRLLAFSRRQPLDPRPVDINPLVASMEELLRRTLGEQIGLDLVVEADALHVLCDPNQLENALLNLCINARDAMSAGGRLTIRTGETILAPGDPRLAASADLAPGRYVHLEVADTGIGMTADIIEHVFEPFFTTKPAGQGTGLGLSMVYGFTRQSKGHCEIHSAPDKGTRVRLLLPCHVRAEPIGDGPAPLRASPRLGNGEAVLVVEDDAVVRQVVVQVLQTLGYVAIEAADAERATDLLASHPIDLLISDIGLPGLGGRQLADAARQAQPGIKVMLMTGYAADAASPAGFLGPDMELITKPFTTEAFGNRVRDMLSPA